MGMVRVREGKSISTSSQSFRASPSLEPFHCRLRLCALAFSHHALSVCRSPAALSIITVHERSLRKDVKTQGFLTLPLCGEEFSSLSSWEEALWGCVNARTRARALSQPPTAGCRSPERARCISASSCTRARPSQRDDARSRASDLPAAPATGAVMVPW
ncbi:hypothetical protein DPX16_2125 [Anabarilius grahami]|uniref:Uncharacterized protein n=1 Tax=Anabarilius grahami TaxID=495550 RepID=A0A3N0XNG4_ANAGA|nr:hypothetical protein DPX16_2125 [Anabarilius grahami]